MDVCSVALVCSTLGDPVNHSAPGSSGGGIFQARILSGSPFLPPGDLSDPEIQPVSCVS